MARIGGCVGRGLGAVALVAVVAVAGLVVPAGPAAAHARLVGSSPATGSTVDRAPAEVAIELDAKPATIEGDPLQVYAPDGRRVDARDPHVSEAGRRLAVTVDPIRPLPAGAYHLAYRVVSADSHVISGRLSFTVRLPSGAGGVALAGPDAAIADDDPGAGSHRLVAAGAHDVRPPLVAAGALALAALALVVRVLWGLWARRARRRRPVARAAPPRAARHPDRHRPGPRPDRGRGGPHGRPPGPRARGHRPPPRTRPGPRRDLVPSGERRAPRPGDGWWP